MPSALKLYGYVDQKNGQEIIELKQVSLCFSGAQEILQFGKFVMRCAEACENEEDWDHEHFFAESGNAENIVLTLLDDANK